ncbi:MAG: TPR end-of-group domain-containing protein [Planctomycetota bacterium]
MSLLLVAGLVSADGPRPRPADVDGAAVTVTTRNTLEERAAGLLMGDDEARATLVAEMRNSSAPRRRAAFGAVARLLRPDALEGQSPEFDTAPPDGTLNAALVALGSGDPLLRDAAVGALIACGPQSRGLLASLEQGKPVDGRPKVPPARARDAALELLRYDVERHFHSLWGPDDGGFKDMFVDLKKHGHWAARFLLAVALDHRVSAGEDLGYGPYRWRCPPHRGRTRDDIRYRALDALGDCGDVQILQRLRAFLRDTPAAELLDDDDRNPIPASWDDALRHTLCALGDSRPVEAIQRFSSPRGWYSRTVEMKRVASANIRIAQYAKDADLRRLRFTTALRYMTEAMELRERGGLGIDAGEYYNLACLLAQRDAEGDRSKALQALEDAVNGGYSITSEWCARDGDLINLRKEARFLVVLEKLREQERGMREDLEQKDD